MKQFMYISGCVLLAASFTACQKKEQTATSVKDSSFVLTPAMKKMIQIDSVQFKDISDELKLSGEISFDENAVVKVYPSISGVVAETKVSLGDKVTKGQELAVMKSADIAGNFSDLNSSAADVAIAKRNYESTQQLYNKGISSEKELTEAKNNYTKALAAQEKIHSLISINGFGAAKQGGMLVIKSPIDGYVVEKKVTTGGFIRNDMGDNLFTISNLKDVWIYANVYEADIPRVRKGFKAALNVLAYPDKTFTTTVDDVSNVLDPNNKIERVRLKLSNPGLLLKPEMFCTVTISNETGEKANCIPSSAIIFDNSKNYVLVYKNDEDISIREVNILRKVDQNVYIHSGLQTGEKIISRKGLLIFNALLQKG